MNFSSPKLALMTLPALLVGGCASGGPVGPLQTADGPSTDIQLVGTGELAPPQPSDGIEGYRAYRIGPFDVLEIGVFGVEELTRAEYRADATGRISFPLAGTIDAAGMTPGELENAIAERLSGQFIRNPLVSVNLKETTSRVVTVAGQVRQPGTYPVLGRMTLIRAVANAGGMGDFAKSNEVLVFRTVDGQKMAALYDLGAIQRGNYSDPELYASDVVVVGDSPQRRLIRDVVGAAPAVLAPILVTLLRDN